MDAPKKPRTVITPHSFNLKNLPKSNNEDGNNTAKTCTSSASSNSNKKAQPSSHGKVPLPPRFVLPPKGDTTVKPTSATIPSPHAFKLTTNPSSSVSKSSNSKNSSTNRSSSGKRNAESLPHKTPISSSKIRDSFKDLKSSPFGSDADHIDRRSITERANQFILKSPMSPNILMIPTSPALPQTTPQKAPNQLGPRSFKLPETPANSEDNNASKSRKRVYAKGSLAEAIDSRYKRIRSESNKWRCSFETHFKISASNQIEKRDVPTSHSVGRPEFHVVQVLTTNRLGKAIVATCDMDVDVFDVNEGNDADFQSNILRHDCSPLLILFPPRDNEEEVSPNLVPGSRVIIPPLQCIHELSTASSSSSSYGIVSLLQNIIANYPYHISSQYIIT
ncbi:hypothetical protein HDU76_006356 [Blyttiomyces sp. JEL0837]|nr:hypothetical protein HDU76_006356 [Blyttiomyces sp. JEL0837]